MRNKIFLRITVCFGLILSMFVVCIARISVIISSPTVEADADNNTLFLKLSNARGNIFDTNGIPFTGRESYTVSVVSPTPSAVLYVSKVLSGDKKEVALASLNSGKPAIISGEYGKDVSGITQMEIPLHTSASQLAVHLIGYTDSSHQGVAGIEKLFDNILDSGESIGVRYAVSGRGEVLSGIVAQQNECSNVFTSGIQTTLDYNIQVVCEQAMKNVKKGSAVVSEIANGKIRAMVSCPAFDPTNPVEKLNSQDSPFINRALCSYNVGSVFKPCIAAAAMENKKQAFFHTCTGSEDIEGVIFHCHNLNGHGSLSLEKAIALSCNTYFYRFSAFCGADNVYSTATSFGFGYKRSLFEGLSSVGENITSIDTLSKSESALANLSIGQGDLLASPLTLLNLYSAIGGGGVYYPLSIIEGEVTKGVLTKSYETGKPTRALSKSTADTLKNYLAVAVKEGTGIKAQPDTTTAAGKTATAQTGRKSADGTPIEHSWFCGFFPLENPKYAVCVMVEDYLLDKTTAAEIFKSIADGITGLNIN